MPPRRSRSTTAFLVLAGLLSLVIAAGSGASVFGIHALEDQLVHVPVGPDCTGAACIPSVEPECVRHACTYLVLGSDTRRGLSREEQARFGSQEQVQGERADTIILVQVDVPHDRTVVLSIPRDLRVEIPGHGVGKINTAFSYGPEVMVRTVRRLTGLRVNHYIQIDFVGFRRAVDALGGVPICVNRPMFDQKAGLRLPRAGCYDLNGAQALAFVRARSVEGDLIPDFSRIARQQQFMRAVINKALSIWSVFKLPSLVRAVGRNLVLSRNLDLYDLQDLSRELADLGQRGVIFRVVPSVPEEVDGVSYLRLVEPDASELFRRMREGRPLGPYGRALPLTALSPANITVRVLDAGAGERAREVADYLTRAGFVVAGPEPAPPRFRESVVVARPRRATEREVVSTYLPGVPLKLGRLVTQGVDVAVVVAPDFPELPVLPSA